MNKTKIAKTLIAALAGTALLSGAAFAADTSSTGSKIDSSMKKVDGFMDDSGIRPKPKRRWLMMTRLKARISPSKRSRVW